MRRFFYFVVNSIPEKELRSFIIEQAKTHREFKNILVAYFSTSLSNGNSHLYAEAIKNAATEFDTKRLLKHKMILLRRMGDNAAANALRLHNLHFPELRVNGRYQLTGLVPIPANQLTGKY